MTTRRELVFAFGLCLLAAPLAGLTREPGKPWRIGYLNTSSPQSGADYFGAFLKGMRELGYVEGRDFVIESRYAEGKYERLPALAQELALMKVDLLLASSSPAIRAARQASSTIPIVMTGTGDPVGSGFVASLARPGGNTTGLSTTSTEISGKHLELLKVMLPRITRVAALSNPGSSSHAAFLENIRIAAKKLGVRLVLAEARSAQEIERGFALMTRERAQALIVKPDGLIIGQERQIAALAARHRLPSIFTNREYAQAGGLMSYGVNHPELFARAAVYVDKILKGAKPGDLPVEQPTKYILTVNRRAAKALGLAIPQELLLRADEVIE